MKKRWTQASSIGTTIGGGLTGHMCPHCAVVGRTAPQKNDSCYFDPKKMKDRRGWARKLVDEKGVACNGDEWQRGTAQTLVHRNPIKEHLSYEASLNCSPTPSYITITYALIILPQKDTGIVDYGATHLYIALSALNGPPNTSASQISVGTANIHVERSSATATLPIPQLKAYFPTTGYIMPSFTNTLVGVGPMHTAQYYLLIKM